MLSRLTGRVCRLDSTAGNARSGYKCREFISLDELMSANPGGVATKRYPKIPAASPSQFPVPADYANPAMRARGMVNQPIAGARRPEFVTLCGKFAGRSEPGLGSRASVVSGGGLSPGGHYETRRQI